MGASCVSLLSEVTGLQAPTTLRERKQKTLTAAFTHFLNACAVCRVHEVVRECVSWCHDGYILVVFCSFFYGSNTPHRAFPQRAGKARREQMVSMASHRLIRADIAARGTKHSEENTSASSSLAMEEHIPYLPAYRMWPAQWVSSR
eukprot:148851-Amphidinium_carterae.1